MGNKQITDFSEITSASDGDMLIINHDVTNTNVTQKISAQNLVGKIDTINEKSTNAGVTVENVPIKDGLVDGIDISAYINQAVLSSSIPIFNGIKMGSAAMKITTSQQTQITDTSAHTIFDFSTYVSGYTYCTALLFLRGHGWGDSTSWKLIGCRIENEAVAGIVVISSNGAVGGGAGSFSGSGTALQGTWSTNGGTIVWTVGGLVLCSN